MKNEASRIQQAIETVRRAWRLTPPEEGYREPLWLKKASNAAAKGGRLPKRHLYECVIDQLHSAGYHKALDHIGIVRFDGQRHVIFEPYESRCSVDESRRIADELASKLQCRAWVSLRSWHNPGATIRITLAPLHTVATEMARTGTTPSKLQDASAAQLWPSQCVCQSGIQSLRCTYL